jgi:hypothetical protein
MSIGTSGRTPEPSEHRRPKDIASGRFAHDSCEFCVLRELHSHFPGAVGPLVSPAPPHGHGRAVYLGWWHRSPLPPKGREIATPATRRGQMPRSMEKRSRALIASYTQLLPEQLLGPRCLGFVRFFVNERTTAQPPTDSARLPEPPSKTTIRVLGPIAPGENVTWDTFPRRPMDQSTPLSWMP